MSNKVFLKACGECSMNVDHLFGKFTHTYSEGCYAKRIEKKKLEKLEQKIILNLNLFASEIILYGYTPNNLTIFAERILEDVVEIFPELKEKNV